VLSKDHRLAKQREITLEELRSEQWLSRNYCEHADRLSASLREHGLNFDQAHQICSERDLIELLEARRLPKTAMPSRSAPKLFTGEFGSRTRNTRFLAVG
jgi:hypothetical protein